MVEIRILVPSDYDSFFALRLMALTEQAHSYGTGAEAWASAESAQVNALLEQSASEDSDSVVFGAFADSVLVGMLGFRRETKAKVVHKATLWGFFVTPTSRGSGVGRALVDALWRYAETCAALHHLRLIVSAPDSVAIALFEKAGFERYGVEPAGIVLDGVYIDQYYYMRSLA